MRACTRPCGNGMAARPVLPRDPPRSLPRRRPNTSHTMQRSRAFGTVTAIAVAVTMAGCGIARKPAPPATDAGGFQGRALGSGIAFRMNNLSREQGAERFRINLYDHGSG